MLFVIQTLIIWVSVLLALLDMTHLSKCISFLHNFPALIAEFNGFMETRLAIT